MSTRHVIADADVLSSFAQAENTPGAASKLAHLPGVYGSPILVPHEVREEMAKSQKNHGARDFAAKLPEGFQEQNPRVVDPELAKHFKLQHDKEKGEVHCIALAEQLASKGDSVLILVTENKVGPLVAQRAKDLGLDISTERTPEILCHSAEKGLINDLKHESAVWHEKKICQFNDAQKQKFQEVHEHIQKHGQKQEGDDQTQANQQQQTQKRKM